MWDCIDHVPAGIFFGVYEASKSLSSRSPTIPKPILHAGASGIAEVAACLVLAPAEVIKQNAQMIRGQSRDGGRSSSLRALRLVAPFRDPKRLWAGYSALVARNLPFTVLQFPMFEYIRGRVRDSRSKRGSAVGPVGVAESGLVSGVSASMAG